MHDKNANCDRDFATGDQFVKNSGGVVLNAILADKYAGRLGWVVLLGDVNPVIAISAWKDLGIFEAVFGDFAFRYSLILGISQSGDGQHQCGKGYEQSHLGVVS